MYISNQPTLRALLFFEVAIPPAAVVKKLFTRLLIRDPSDVEKLFYVLIWRLLPPNQKIRNTFQRQRRLGSPGCLVDMYNAIYHCRVNTCNFCTAIV